MSSEAAPAAIVITGPTGTGKSELAVEVAERVGGEIISADSRQVCRYMDIGTAKPPETLRQRVPHHGLDRVSPDESYSAGRFAREARDSIRQIRARGHLPIVVGGTGFFVRALLDPLSPEPHVDRARRDRLRRHLSVYPVDQLKCWLQRLDPVRAEELEREGGQQRLARSLEVVLTSGKTHSWWFLCPPEAAPIRALVFCLQLAREKLYRRIDDRLDRMIADGMLDEVRDLLDRHGSEAPGLRAVGYAELVSHLLGERTMDDAVEHAKRSARRFARRQMTWFRHQLPDDAVWLDAEVPLEQLVGEIVELWSDRVTTADTGHTRRPSLASD